MHSPKGTNEKLGNVVIRGEERRTGSRAYYKIKFLGNNFKPQSIFYRLNKLLNNDQFVAVYESETSNRTPDGRHEFKEIDIHSMALVNDDETRKAMIEVFQW